MNVIERKPVTVGFVGPNYQLALLARYFGIKALGLRVEIALRLRGYENTGVTTRGCWSFRCEKPRKWRLQPL